jgi:hypothetical protein
LQTPVFFMQFVLEQTQLIAQHLLTLYKRLIPDGEVVLGIGGGLPFPEVQAPVVQVRPHLSQLRRRWSRLEPPLQLSLGNRVRSPWRGPPTGIPLPEDLLVLEHPNEQKKYTKEGFSGLSTTCRTKKKSRKTQDLFFSV